MRLISEWSKDTRYQIFPCFAREIPDSRNQKPEKQKTFNSGIWYRVSGFYFTFFLVSGFWPLVSPERSEGR